MNVSGRIKLSTAFWLLLLAAGVYTGLAFGAVYWHKYQVTDIMQRELGFAGQRTNEAIRERLVLEIAELNLPRQAQQVRLVQTSSPRALVATTTYVDTVNLLVTKRAQRVTVEARRIY